MEARSSGKILLEWQMPDRQQTWYSMIPTAGFMLTFPIAVAILLYADKNRFIGLEIFAVGQVLARLFIWPHTGAAVQLRCTGTGISFEPLLDLSHEVPWSRVKCLKRTWQGHKVLKFRGLFGGCIYLRVPNDVLRELRAILREHSTARIIGFD